MTSNFDNCITASIDYTRRDQIICDHMEIIKCSILLDTSDGMFCLTTSSVIGLRLIHSVQANFLGTRATSIVVTFETINVGLNTQG